MNTPAKREVKFRVWDTELKKMSGGYDLCDAFFNHKENRGSEKSNCIIMQYTGSKDKNGKGIYEGDFVKQFGNKNPLLVEWSQSGFRYNGIYLIHEIKSVEVIGNIYENEELLNPRQ